MKIAVYFDLPPGGASRTMEELIKIFRENNEIAIFHNETPKIIYPFAKRLFVDLESVLFQKRRQKVQAKIIDSKKFDVVFVSHDKHSQAPWILRFLKTPTVFLCQEPTRSYFEEFLKVSPTLPFLNKTYETVNRYIRKNIEIRNASFANRIIANSVYSTESIFRAYGVYSEPVYLGIDSKEYFPDSSIKKNQILVIGNNEPQKDLLFAIEIISKIPKGIRPTLVVASPRNSNIFTLKQLAKKLKVKLKILVGLNPEQLRKVYSQSLVTLAVAHLEPFGLSVVESFACGTPVVAINEAGFRETIVNNKTGILTKRNSVVIANEILKLLQNKTLLKQMGKNGKRDVNARFTWKRTADEILKIFYETSSRHR